MSHPATFGPCSPVPASPTHEAYGIRFVSAPELEAIPALPGSSIAATRLRNQVQRIGRHFRRVLVSGEPGSDRERVARALWACSPAGSGPFLVCAMAHLEETASLAVRDPRRGRLALRRMLAEAAMGMLWINDVSSLSGDAQALLLRLLEEPCSGGERVRLAVGTTADLKVRALAGNFMPELHLALAQIEIVVPPLRERVEDLPEIARTAVGNFAREYALPVADIAEDALSPLSSHLWPGNEAELHNVLRAAVLACAGGVLRAEHLPSLVDQGNRTAPSLVPEMPERLQDVIDQHVLRTLTACDGNKLRAADRLGISRSTLYRMLDTCAGSGSS